MLLQPILPPGKIPLKWVFSWMHLGSLLGRLEAVLEQLGALLGRLGASWALLSCLGDYLGPFWALLETTLGPYWAPLGSSCWSMLDRLETFEERYEDEVESSMF